MHCASSTIFVFFAVHRLLPLHYRDPTCWVGSSNTAFLIPNSPLLPRMPFLGKCTKHRRYGQIGPYGPGAAFAIGSGERLASRRREIAQTKACMRRYPGILPQAVNAVGGGMFEYDHGAGHMNGFGSVPYGASFGQFEESGWKDPAVTILHPFLRNSFRTLPVSASSRDPAFGTQRQYFWPDGGFREGFSGSPGLRLPTRGEDLPEELYAWRQPEDDYLDTYGGLRTRPFPHSFNNDQRCSFSPPQSVLFRDHRYHGSGGGRGDVPSNRQDDQPHRGGQLNADGPQPRSWRGSPRDSYERLRPEDL
jgi:hypothetical protein